MLKQHELNRVEDIYQELLDLGVDMEEGMFKPIGGPFGRTYIAIVCYRNSS